MFAKKYRLTKRSDFQSVFKEGKRGFGKFFSIRYRVNDLGHPRIAVVASAKVSKKAVERNRLKRQTRKIVTSTISDFCQNFDIIVNILSPALSQKFKILEEELIKIFQKNKIIKR